MSENTEAKTLTIPASVKVPFTWSPSKGAEAHIGEITFDLTALEPGDILEYALDSLIIKHQGGLRRTFGTEKWTAPKTRREVNEDGTESDVEVYEVKAPRPGERKNADPQKKAARDMAKFALESGVDLETLKKLVLAAKGGLTGEPTDEEPNAETSAEPNAETSAEPTAE